MMSMVTNFMYPPPPSLFITTMSVISFVSLAYTAFSEIRGKHLQYSKFWNINTSQKVKLSSRTGMLILYTPAFVVGAVSLYLLADNGLRVLLVTAALTIHFLKRVLEVMYVHKYSGAMILDSIIPISPSYFTSTASMIYNQYLVHDMAEPQVDLKYAGVFIYLVGIVGNFYHHLLLSKLRSNDEGVKEYKIPKGGLFSQVICPHYFFEILVFVGICLISQTLYPICFTIGTMMYLTARSYVTRKWYVSKFPNFPKDVKALVPYVL